MPNYSYKCRNCRARWEQRADYDDDQLVCACGMTADRVQVYREQYMSAETGPRGGRKNEPPRGEKSYRKQYQEFREASAEIDYAATRAEIPEKNRPNFYKEGLRQAKKKGAKIASN